MDVALVETSVLHRDRNSILGTQFLKRKQMRGYADYNS